MLENRILWYDFETSGPHPALDRPIQMGWQYSDQFCNAIESPKSVFVKLPSDCLPSLEAFRIHGITPQTHQMKGISEPELASKFRKLNTPGITVAGYNSRSFDDRFLQNIFYRSLYDPFAWQWEDNRKRFDLFPVVIAFFVLEKESLIWPVDSNGVVRFKLDRLAPANNISEGKAHDAAVDSFLTSQLAKKMHLHNPEFFEYAVKLSSKHFVIDLIRKYGRQRGLVEISPKVGLGKGFCRWIWIPFRRMHGHPDYFGIDLAKSPEELLSEIKNKNTSENNQKESAIVRIATNAQPILIEKNSLNKMQLGQIEKYDFNWSRQSRNLDFWQKFMLSGEFKSFYQNVCSYMAFPRFDSSLDVDLSLHAKFINDSDRKILLNCPRFDPHKLKQWKPKFSDSRYDELLFRYRARHWPGSLTPFEKRRWLKVRKIKLLNNDSGGVSWHTLNNMSRSRITETDWREDELPKLNQFFEWLDSLPPI